RRELRRVARILERTGAPKSRLLGQRFEVVAAAHRDVTFVAADLNLLAFAQTLAVGADAQVHGGLAAAVADGFQLNEIVGEGEQRTTAFEKVALKISAQPVA